MPCLPRKMARRHRAPKPHPSAPPHAMSATPATRNEGRCEFVPRLPRETKVEGTTLHPLSFHVAGVAQIRIYLRFAWQAWHSWHGVARLGHRAPKPHPSAPPHAMSATPATRNEGRCEFVPRLPRESKVDVSLCHTCHVKRKWM